MLIFISNWITALFRTGSPSAKSGRKGEQKAVSYLKKQGFKILEKNWRWKRYEIDVIAQKGALTLFVEVKLRTHDGYIPAKALVNARKRDSLRRAARAYLKKTGNSDALIRFDVIIVLKRNTSTFEIQHAENVFTIRR